MEKHEDVCGGDSGGERAPEEMVDIEDYAKRGEKPPLAKGYRIKVNGQAVIMHDPNPTGRDILTEAGLTPPEDYTLRVKRSGERPKKVELDERVDLRHPGVEKFKALPRDQTEG